MSKRVFTPNKRMIEVRRENRLSQQRLAEDLRISTSWVSKIEQGREFPSKELAKEIANHLGAQPEYLFPDLFDGQ